MDVTTNLSDFGHRELEIARDLLTAMLDYGLPDDFDDGKVTIAFNPNSGYVFLTNGEYQVAMLTDDGDLESWYYLPYSGEEGFYDDLIYMVKDADYFDDDDIEFLIDLARDRGDDEAIEMLKSKIEGFSESYKRRRRLRKESYNKKSTNRHTFSGKRIKNSERLNKRKF